MTVTVDATSLAITSKTASDPILAGFTTDIGEAWVQGLAAYCK